MNGQTSHLEIEPGAEVSHHIITEMPVLVLLPHNRCNCRCVMCDIWKIRQVRELSASDLAPHLESFRRLKVRWIVFSGGEPLMHSDLYELARLLRNDGIRLSLLTAGLTLHRHAENVSRFIDDVIVSLDGPREVHDQIRGVPDAFRRLEQGIRSLRAHRPTIEIHARCTVQRDNVRHLRALALAAYRLEIDSVSFLAADLSSQAFNHAQPMSAESAARVALDENEIEELAKEIDGLIEDSMVRLPREFIRESPAKLHRIVTHFKAQLGQVPSISPPCNAPWVSAVVESGGKVRPCFFHPPIGDIHSQSFEEIVNGDIAITFRRQLDVANDPVCQKCVCSLRLRPNSVGANLLPSRHGMSIPIAGASSD